MTVLPDAWLRHDPWLRLARGILLCSLGLRVALSEGPKGSPTAKTTTLLRAYAATFLLTLCARLDLSGLRWVNRAAGILLAGCGMLLLTPIG